MRTKGELTEAIRRDRRAVLVINARSRRGRHHYQRARVRLAAAGFICSGVAVDRPASWRDLASALTSGLTCCRRRATGHCAPRHVARHAYLCLNAAVGTHDNFARTSASAGPDRAVEC